MNENGATSAPSRAFITLGSNIQPERYLPRALLLLAERVKVLDVSRVYQSAPRDANGQVMADQGYFLNAAALVETDLSPVALKYEVLRPIEQTLGRVRTDDKFAPRPIDLDIALYDHEVLVLETVDYKLNLPDPDILTRAHVALPLADLAPDYSHPITGETLASIAARFAGLPDIVVREDVILRV